MVPTYGFRPYYNRRRFRLCRKVSGANRLPCYFAACGRGSRTAYWRRRASQSSPSRSTHTHSHLWRPNSQHSKYSQNSK